MKTDLSHRTSHIAKHFSNHSVLQEPVKIRVPGLSSKSKFDEYSNTQFEAWFEQASGYDLV